MEREPDVGRRTPGGGERMGAQGQEGTPGKHLRRMCSQTLVRRQASAWNYGKGGARRDPETQSLERWSKYCTL